MGKENKMNIIVVPAEKNRFKVLDNYIQVGIDYSSMELAQQEASKLRSSKCTAENHNKPNNS